VSNTLRERLVAALEPLDSWTQAGEASHSDFDLNPEFRPTDRPLLRDAAVLIPVVDHPEGPTVLLTRRAEAMTSHSGQVAFPGGRLDPGETAVQAAVREAMEEVGLDASFIEPLGLSHRYETVTGYMVTPVVALVRPGFTLTLNPGEVAEAFETPLDFLMEPNNHVRAFYERGGRKRWFYRIPWQGHDIWGATAGMIRALRARLYGDDPEGAMIGEPAARDGGPA
jgi:8-oxo-dGTP pyrophosphatase MutT (NUDIX family)